MRALKSYGRFGVLCALIVAATLLWQGFPAAGQAKDPLVGNWLLNRGKSEFYPDTTLQSRTVMFEAVDNGLHFLQKTVTDRGNTVESEYTAKFDGKDYPISGSTLDTVSIKRVDANTVERIGKIQGKQVETATIQASGGGEMLTITTTGSFDGDDYSSTQVFDRQGK
jgi:hypothetical protein